MKIDELMAEANKRMELYKQLDNPHLTRNERIKIEGEIDILLGEIVTLIPIAMVTPTRESIYAPSRISKPRVIGRAEFMLKYSDHPRQIKVSFEADGKSNWQEITAYGFGPDAWYILG